MNDKVKELAEKAGFVLWGDETWNPGDTIDWSCRYDDELVNYTDLVIQMCADHIMGSSDRYRKEYFANKVLELKSG
jgi:hypothetical protein